MFPFSRLESRLNGESKSEGKDADVGGETGEDDLDGSAGRYGGGAGQYEPKELNEFTIAEKLARFRAENDNFMRLSFSTIAGAGANGAIIHYFVSCNACSQASSIICLSSGLPSGIHRSLRKRHALPWKKRKCSSSTGMGVECHGNGPSSSALCSGAQYRDGTTDITRTVHFGNPAEKERFCFTQVLKGHIAMATVRAS